MLKCHWMHCQVILEAKSLDPVASSWNLNEVCIKPMMELEFEQLKWIDNFFACIDDQKSNVKALNGWLAPSL